MRIEVQRDFGRRECPACAVDVEANQNRCPLCGYEFPPIHPGRRAWIVTVALVLLFVLIGGLLRYLPWP